MLKLFLVTIGALVATMWLTVAHAFSVEPTQTTIHASPGGAASSTMLLVNDESKTQIYTFSVRAFTSHESGVPDFVSQPELESWFIVPTSTFVLEAGRTASIPYFFLPPLDAKPGGYSVAIFAEARAVDSAAVRAIPSVGMLVFATVLGETDSTFHVVSSLPRFAIHWPIETRFVVQNTGMRHLAGDVSVRIHTMIGGDDVQEVAKSTTVLPQTERMYEYTIERHGVWRFLPMMYTIEWAFTSTDEHVNDSSYIVVVPWYSVVAVACFGLFAYTKRKRYVA